MFLAIGRPMRPSPMNPTVSDMRDSILAAGRQFPTPTRQLRRCRMYVVLVQVTVRSEMLEEFERLLMHNARESVARDRGCLRFDVSQHVDDPTRWVLHEVYDVPESHAAHRQSPHFLAYDAFTRDAVIEKAVARCIAKHVT